MPRQRAVCSTVLATIVACQLLFQAHGSLMAIDLGSEYLKLCLVKPGRTPISIVVNEMSRRKSPAVVGLVDEGRVLGEEAYSLGIRYPNSIFSQLRNLLGRSADDAEVKRVLEDNLLPYVVVNHPERGTAALPYNDTTTYLIEELVAGIFQYAKQLTDAQAGESVVDTVIVVPAWFGIAQRQAVIDSASLAGLNVLGLMNSHSAAALQYGIERDFSKKEQKVILYDMGSGSTEAALVKYSTYGKAGSSSSKGLTNQFEVLDIEWDHSLGSNTLELLLAEHFAKEFDAKHGVDVRTVPKSMAKLRRQVRRTKEILSANTAAPISVEELHGGKDFQSSISRDDFEKLAGPFWERAKAPLVKLLQRNKLSAKDVDAVELLGGGSRVPKLQAVLSEALDGRHLDRHLDADEAVVLGAGLFAANLSSSFRLRKFGMTDVAAFGVTFESHDLFTPAPSAKLDESAAAAAGSSKKGRPRKDKKAPKDKETVEAAASTKSGHVVKSLLPAGKKLPIKRAIKYTNLTIDGFSFELRYNTTTPHGLPPGVTDPNLASYTVSGIQDAIKRYNHSGISTLRFEADYSSLLHFSSAECVVEVEVIENKTIEIPAPPENGTSGDSAAPSGTAGDSAASGTSGDHKSETVDGTSGDSAANGDSRSEGEDGTSGDAAAAAANGTEAGNSTNGTEVANQTTIKMVKKVIQVPRRRVYHVALNVSGPGPAYTPLSGDVWQMAQAQVAAWRAAEAVKAATAKAKNDLEAYIIGTREKLETDELIQQVTAEADRVKFIEQLTEAEDWLYGDGEHEAADQFVAKLQGLKAVGDPIQRRAAELELRPKVLDAVKQSVAAAENITASWADTKPWINETDTQDANDKIQEFQKWLQEQEAAQTKKELTEEPAFTGMDILSKWESVQKMIKKVDGKKKPKVVPKNETDSAAAAGDKAAAGDEAAAAAAAEEGKSEEEGYRSESAADAEQQQQQEVDEELPPHEEL